MNGEKMHVRMGLEEDWIKENINKGEFGLEKEALRIDENGFLSHTKHPFAAHPNITRDFCENQVELVTDVFDSAADARQHLKELQSAVVKRLQQQKTKKEWLWHFSNPPYVKGEDDIPIAQFDYEQRSKTEYRNYLAEKYGKRKMLFCGIHLNYSFSDKMLQEAYQKVKSDFLNYQSYKDQVYLKLAKQAVRYSWFLVYLMAASPVLDSSFFTNFKDGEKQKDEILEKYASIRCGKYGYWNDFTPVFHYENIKTYTESIEAYIRQGMLISVSELYYPVRLKPKGENSIEHLRENGISHIELRMLDVNPLSMIGIFEEDLEFLHYFLIYLTRFSDAEFTEEEQLRAVINVKNAARFKEEEIFIETGVNKTQQIKKAAMDILENMEVFYGKLNEKKVLETIQYQKDKISVPNNRYADRIMQEYGNNYVKKGVALSEKYAKEITK